MRKKLKYIICIVGAIFILCSCSDNKGNSPDTQPVESPNVEQKESDKITSKYNAEYLTQNNPYNVHTAVIDETLYVNSYQSIASYDATAKSWETLYSIEGKTLWDLEEQDNSLYFFETNIGDLRGNLMKLDLKTLTAEVVLEETEAYDLSFYNDQAYMKTQLMTVEGYSVESGAFGEEIQEMDTSYIYGSDMYTQLEGNRTTIADTAYLLKCTDGEYLYSESIDNNQAALSVTSKSSEEVLFDYETIYYLTPEGILYKGIDQQLHFYFFEEKSSDLILDPYIASGEEFIPKSFDENYFYGHVNMNGSFPMIDVGKLARIDRKTKELEVFYTGSLGSANVGSVFENFYFVPIRDEVSQQISLSVVNIEEGTIYPFEEFIG